MTVTNDWHSKQKRTEKNLFAPKWSQETILWIIDQLNQMTDFADIQMALIKQYKISLVSTYSWIEMSRRIMKDMDNGFTIEAALERDQDRRNMFRRRAK